MKTTVAQDSSVNVAHLLQKLKKSQSKYKQSAAEPRLKIRHHDITLGTIRPTVIGIDKVRQNKEPQQSVLCLTSSIL